MRIVLLNDTRESENWGCNSTVAGLLKILEDGWPDAEISTAKVPSLPFRKIPALRKFFDRKLCDHLLSDQSDNSALFRSLRRMNFSAISDPLPDRIYINGEGMLHSKSGHLIRLLGTMAYYKAGGAWVAAVNQTIDLSQRPELNSLIARVFTRLDHVTVRDPISLEYLHGLGVNEARLVPDAAFASPWPDETDQTNAGSGVGLPPDFVAMTGSSALKPRQVETFERFLTLVRAKLMLPVVMLCSTKTDRRFFDALRGKSPDLTMVAPPATYQDAMAVISKAKVLVGGRFHPMIFAARAGTPIIGCAGNTHKTQGLLDLLEYPIPSVNWNDLDGFEQALATVRTEGPSLGIALQNKAEKLTGQVIGIRD